MAGYSNTLAAYMGRGDKETPRRPSGYNSGYLFQDPTQIPGYASLLMDKVKTGEITLDEYLHRLSPTPRPGQAVPKRLYRDSGEWIRRLYPFRPPPYDMGLGSSRGRDPLSQRQYWETVQRAGQPYMDNFSPLYPYLSKGTGP